MLSQSIVKKTNNKKNECIRELHELVLRHDVDPDQLFNLARSMVMGSNDPIISCLQSSALFEFLAEYYPLNEQAFMKHRNRFIKGALDLT